MVEIPGAIHDQFRRIWVQLYCAPRMAAAVSGAWLLI
jgi:hypothetical protein